MGKRREIHLNIAVLGTIPAPASGLSFSCIADLIGCTPQAVEQMEKRALEKLKKHFPRDDFNSARTIQQLA